MIKKVLWWLWKNSKGFHNHVLFISIAGILRILVGLAFIYASKVIIDIATGNAQGNILVIAFIMIGIVGCEIGIDAFSTWIEKSVDVKLQNLLRRNLFNRLLQAEWRGIEKHHSGDLINRIEQDVKDVVAMLVVSFPTMLITGVQFIASFIFLVFLDGMLAWILVGIMPFFLIASKIYFKKMRKLTHGIRNSNSEIQSVIQESLQSRMVIKTLERGETLLERLGGLQSILQHQVKQKTQFSIFSQSMIMTGFIGGYLISFFWGIFRLSTGSITFGVMAAFLQLVGQVQRPVVYFTRQIPTLITGFTASERLMELEQLQAEEQGAQIIIDKPLGLKIENVSFTYDETDRQLFDGFSFDFSPNSSIAILGETGAGKTSLIRLMLSLIKPQQGDLYLYDNEGHHYTISALTRGNFVYVPQGNTLFSGTIRDNLLLGNPDATEADLRTALEITTAGFVFSLPHGLDTLCGERGGGLSEGQSQRIAIARALLRPGRILLLDEATSALDAQTETILLSRLKEQAAGKTVIFVTHRMTIANMCDMVLNIKT